MINNLKKYEKQNIPSFVMDLITDLLLSGELKPGDKLPTENEFSEKLGVSRNSIREAIKMLSCIGVVEIRRAEGTFISKNITSPMLNPLILNIALADILPKELIELRLLFDTAITKLICSKISNEQIENLKILNLKILDEVQKDVIDKQKIQKYDMEFHIFLMNSANNSLINKIGKTIYTLFFNSMEKSITTDPKSVYKNHKIIIEALETRNKKLANDAIIDSLAHWKELTERSS